MKSGIKIMRNTLHDIPDTGLLPSTSVENVRQISHILCQTNPISERLKLMQIIYLQRVMKLKQNWGFVKTKPIKANNQSSLIDNQLTGKPNSPIVQTNVRALTKMIYTIFASLTKVKFKPNSNPIFIRK